jgi:hypothetical protein
MTAGPLLMQHQLYTQAVRHMAACSVVCGLVLGLVFVVYEFGLLVPWLAIWTAVLGLAGLLLNPFNFLHRLDRFAFLRYLILVRFIIFE